MNLDRELKRYVRQIRPGLIGATSNPNANLNQLIEEIKVAKQLRTELVPRLQDFLLTRDYVSALTEAGLTLESGVFGEVFRRLEYKLLPKPVESASILSFLSRIFDAQADGDWLEKIDRERFGEFLTLIMPGREQIVEALAPQFFMSLEILSLRLAGLGYDPIVTERLRARREYQNAFMDVTRHVHAMLDGKGEAAIPLIRDDLKRCADGVDWVRSRRATDGISLALTYRLMKIQQVLRRMELLLEMIEAILGEWKSKPAADLFFEIVLAEIRRFNLRSFLVQNIELLAFQITEHTGKAGEHYITRTRSEWNTMFTSAAIGGAVTGVMVILKVIGSHLHLPPGPDALLNAMIYSVGFIVIHTLGGTLATKQPAMTASTLAASLDEANSQKRMENLSEIIVCTFRSQLIAVLGNYLIAFPVAAFVVLPFYMSGHPLMGHEKAIGMIEALHPYKTLALLYAGMAGVGLFLSGLVAGFVDNWYVFNHVGSRLKNSEVLRGAVGAPNLAKTIQLIDHNLGFWVGNITLGFYLAFVPAFGDVFGLPLSVRHITFSSGQLGAALATLHFQVTPELFAITAIGIFMFGMMNLGVSFTLSLLVAVKSRRIKFSQTPELLRHLGRRLRTRPTEFFFPPAQPASLLRDK